MFIRGFDRRRKNPSNIIASKNQLISEQHQKLNEFLFNNESSYADNYRFVSNGTHKTQIKRLASKLKQKSQEKSQSLTISKEQVIRKIKQRLLQQQYKPKAKIVKQQQKSRYSHQRIKGYNLRPANHYLNRPYLARNSKLNSLNLKIFNNSTISQKTSLNFNSFVKPYAVKRASLTERPKTQDKIERSRKYSTTISKQFTRSRTWKHQSLQLNGKSLAKNIQKPYLDPWSQIDDHQV